MSKNRIHNGNALLTSMPNLRVFSTPPHLNHLDETYLTLVSICERLVFLELPLFCTCHSTLESRDSSCLKHSDKHSKSHTKDYELRSTWKVYSVFSSHRKSVTVLNGTGYRYYRPHDSKCSINFWKCKIFARYGIHTHALRKVQLVGTAMWF